MELSKSQLAHLSGLFYFLLVLTGIFSLMYVPTQLINWENATKTVANIQENELLFRAGAVANILCYIFFIFLLWALYRLLSDVQSQVATIMVALAGCSIPMALYGVHYQFYTLKLISASSDASVWSSDQIEAFVMQSLSAYNSGIFVADILWSLWLFPFGYLVFRSRFLPKLLGGLLMIGSVGYFLHVVGHMLFPDINRTLSEILRFPASIAEIGTSLWLLIMGTKKITFRKNNENHHA